MPGLMCAVFGCNNSWKFAKANGLSISFHVFPRDKDIVSKTRREKWIWSCKRADNWNPDTSRICSEHFCAEDFERDMRNELLGLPRKKKLNKNAVPTLNLPGSSENIILHIVNEDDALNEGDDPNEGDPPIKCEPLSEGDAPNEVDALSEADALNEVDALSEDDILNEHDAPSERDIREAISYNELIVEYLKLKQEYDDFRQSSKTKIKLLQNNLNYYKKKYYNKSFKQKYNFD